MSQNLKNDLVNIVLLGVLLLIDASSRLWMGILARRFAIGHLVL